MILKFTASISWVVCATVLTVMDMLYPAEAGIRLFAHWVLLGAAGGMARVAFNYYDDDTSNKDAKHIVVMIFLSVVAGVVAGSALELPLIHDYLGGARSAIIILIAVNPMSLFEGSTKLVKSWASNPWSFITRWVKKGGEK